MAVKGKKHNIKDESGLVDKLVERLLADSFVRLVHFGQFEVKTITGRKVYNRIKRAMVAVPPYKQVVFSPANGLRDMLNRHGARGKNSRSRTGVSP